MSPWVYDPHSGGVPIPPKVQEETRARILAAARNLGLKSVFRLEVRFKGPFCYIDAHEPDSPVPTHLCRLRYLPGREPKAWSLAFYTYSHEKYEPCLFPSGEELGTPEQGLEVGSFYLT